jgi:MFS transporter, DHA2 family, multidrug resistance protein
MATAIPALAPPASTKPAVLAPAMTPGQTTRLLLGLGLATWTEFYTFDSVNLVLPDMAGSLGVSQDEATWILTTYNTALFLGVPLSIASARYFGHWRFIIGSIIGFAVASLGCTFATDFTTLLAWRALQGLAGAGLTVWWRASIYMLMPGPKRGGALMRVSVMLYLSTAVGLVFGGLVTDNLDWHLIFLPNVVVGAGAVWLLARNYPDVPVSVDPRLPRTDALGIALLAVSLVAFAVVLSRGEVDDWFGSTRIQAMSWTAAIAGVLFLFWQTSPRNAAPLLNLALIRDRNVVAASSIGVLSGIIIAGSVYALPEFLRTVQGRNATETGQVLCVYALTAALIRPLVTPTISRFGERKAAAFSFLMLVASMLLMAHLITTGTPDAAFALPLVLYAFCLAPMLSAVGRGTVSRMPQASQLDTVSIYMTCRQFGSAIGVALVTVVLSQRETLHSSRLFEHLRANRPVVHDWLVAASSAVADRGGDAHQIAMRLLDAAAVRQAATLAYADAYFFMAAIGVVTLCFVPLMRPTLVGKK